MRRTARLTALAAVILSGCPLPQPLPDYPEGQPVTPPRIVVDDTVRAVLQPDSIVRVPAGCPREPVYRLGATLRDAITNEVVVARWFVNYDPTNRPNLTPQQDNDILAPADGSVDPTLRETPAFEFPAYQYASAAGSGATGGAGALHVVELVVSNGFDPNADSATAALPYRKPKLGFEVQVYRWVFLTVPPSPDTCTGAGCVTCPPPPVVPAG